MRVPRCTSLDNELNINVNINRKFNRYYSSNLAKYLKCSIKLQMNSMF